MTLRTRQDLADWALRQLGAPILNVEVEDDQLDDNVELAIQYYREYHFDGIERDYLAYKITATVLTLTNATGLLVGTYLTGNTSGVKIKVKIISGNDVTITKQLGPNRLAPLETLTDGVNTYTIASLVAGTIDNEWIPTDPTVVGVNKILNLSSIMSSGDFIFNAQYQIMMSEIQNLTSSGFSYLYGTMNYLGNLDFVMKKERDFRFNRRWQKLYLDINWESDVAPGDYIVIDLYRYLDDAVFIDVLNDMWLKKYTTALIKKQWGGNLKKYQGMQLPGGLTYNGQQYFDEAIAEIKALEDEAINFSAPLGFMVG